MGSANTNGVPMGRLRIVSNQKMGSTLLVEPLENGHEADDSIHSPVWNLMKLLQCDTHKDDQPNEGTAHEADTNISIDKDTVHHCYSLLNNSFVLIVLSIHMELCPPAWALRNSPFIQTTS
jgi:hypothetical protein